MRGNEAMNGVVAEIDGVIPAGTLLEVLVHGSIQVIRYKFDGYRTVPAIPWNGCKYMIIRRD